MPTWNKNFGAIFPCLLVVPAVCFGIARDPCRASQGLCNVLTTIQSFCNITRQSALLNLEILYDRTLIESNSYHHHHHNGHEICFVLLCNTREHKICSWSEIIELVRFKLKEYYIKHSLRHCHKIYMPWLNYFRTQDCVEPKIAILSIDDFIL